MHCVIYKIDEFITFNSHNSMCITIMPDSLHSKGVIIPLTQLINIDRLVDSQGEL